MKKALQHGSEFATRIATFIRRGFSPHYDELGGSFKGHPLWEKIQAARTELWFDSGDIDAVSGEWTREFSGLTTNNTLLNREIQKGTYDAFIVEAARELERQGDLTEQERKLEMAFMLNARHALKLVEKFDAHVSVEEHTDLAHDVEGAVGYARRFHDICPERFIIKIPFSAAGLLATRRVTDLDIPVNHTLGFSARQNYIIASIGRPSFVNVFLGRLNSFVADNDLGSGDYVGEKALLASQSVVRSLRSEKGLETRQIGASIRAGVQIRDLVGVDVLTMPIKAAREFLDLGLRQEEVNDRRKADYQPGIGAAAKEAGIATLWDVDDRLKSCVQDLESSGIDTMEGADLIAFFAGHNCADVLVDWTADQVALSRKEGKIPKLRHWQDLLRSGRVGLDSLMNLAGLNSFAADQEEMDHHVSELLAVS